MKHHFLTFLKHFIPALAGQLTVRTIIITPLGLINPGVVLGIEFMGAMGVIFLDRWVQYRLDTDRD